MENMYGVGVTNRYALFLAEEDPLEQLKAKEKAREEKKKKLPLVGAEKENKGVKTPPVKNKPALKVTDGIKDNQNVVKTETQPKKEATTAKPKKPEKVKYNDDNILQTDRPKDTTVTDNSNSTGKDNNSYYSNSEEPVKERRYNGEGGRDSYQNREGRGGGRGGRGGGGRGRGTGRREYDRHTGPDKMELTTGDNHSDFSRERGNQDGKQNDTVSSNENNIDKPVETAVSSGDAPASVTEAEDQAAKEITLDEWKVTRGSKLLKPQYNLRKPGEGEDLTRWQGMYELKGKKEEARLIEEEKAAKEIAAKAPKKKEVVDTNFHFADQPTRGGRGKGRGGMRGDRGGPRGDKPSYNRGPRSAPRVDVTNEHDFPSLG